MISSRTEVYIIFVIGTSVKCDYLSCAVDLPIRDQEVGGSNPTHPNQIPQILTDPPT
jgi:hypothetical protein